MKTVDDLHLPEDRLISSLVDKDALDAGELAHLRDCPTCSADLSRIEHALANMARTATDLTPPLRRRLTVPSRTASSVLPKPFRFRSALRSPWMVGAAAAVALLVVFGLNSSRKAQEKQLAGIRQEMIEDERFLTELSKLEESGLPEMSAALSDEFDSDEDDFLDFVVPDPTGDATTRVPSGGNLC